MATLLYEQFVEDFDTYRKDFWQADSDYTPNLDLPFDYEWFVCKWDEAKPHNRLFDVERDGDRLHLYGIGLVAASSIPEDLRALCDFFEREGCSDIQFNFYSRRRKPD